MKGNDAAKYMSEMSEMQHRRVCGYLTIQSFSGMLTQHEKTLQPTMTGPAPRSSTTTYLAILGGTIVWCLAFVLPPVFLPAGGAWAVTANVAYSFFHPICHQLKDRSLLISGEPLAVCARCCAIYFGFLLGTIIHPPVTSRGLAIQDKRLILVASVVPMCLDVMLDIAGIHASTTVTRLMTGSLFGLIVPFYVIPAAQAAVQELLTPSPFTPSDTKKGQLHA